MFAGKFRAIPPAHRAHMLNGYGFLGLAMGSLVSFRGYYPVWRTYLAGLGFVGDQIVGHLAHVLDHILGLHGPLFQ